MTFAFINNDSIGRAKLKTFRIWRASKMKPRNWKNSANWPWARWAYTRPRCRRTPPTRIGWTTRPSGRKRRSSWSRPRCRNPGNRRNRENRRRHPRHRNRPPLLRSRATAAGPVTRGGAWRNSWVAWTWDWRTRLTPKNPPRTSRPRSTAPANNRKLTKPEALEQPPPPPLPPPRWRPPRPRPPLPPVVYLKS